MYVVVGCPACRQLWIRQPGGETCACPRCGRRHRVETLRALVRVDTVEAAREARSALLAERSDADDAAGYLELEDELAAAGLPEEAMFEATGIDPDAVRAVEESPGKARRSAPERILALLEKLEPVRSERIESAAAEHGIDVERAGRILADLRETGEVVRTEEGYRRV